VNIEASVIGGIGIVARSAVIWSFQVTTQVDSSHLYACGCQVSPTPELSFDVFAYYSTYSGKFLPGDMVRCS